MQPCQVCSPDHTGIVDQLSDGELRLRMIPPRGQVGEICFPDRIQEGISRDSHSAAEHEELRIQYRTERSTRLPQPAPEFSKSLKRSSIFCHDQTGYIVAGERPALLTRLREPEPDASDVSDLARHTQERTTRTVLLDAAACAATARQATGNDPHVAELCPSAKSTAK